MWDTLSPWAKIHSERPLPTARPLRVEEPQVQRERDLRYAHCLLLSPTLEQPEEFQGAAGIVLDLCFEDGGVLKLDFIAQPVDELDFHIRVVDLTACVVEKKSFDRETVIVTKRGFVAHIGDGVIRLSSKIGARHVDSSFWQLFLSGSKIERRNGVFTSHPQARNNRPISGEGPSQQPVGQMDAAFHQQLSDATAGNSLPAHFEQRQGQHFHFETFLTAEFVEYFHIARLTISKAKVRSYMDGHSVQRLDQNVLHELEGER